MPTINQFCVCDVGPREWGREIVIAHTSDYLGKVLLMHAGAAGGLQYHREKIETFYLHSGRALVTTDKGDGILVSFEIQDGDSIHVPAGAVHKVTAITDCTFFECSTPVFDDRVRMEERYGLTVEGGLPTTR